MSEFDAHLATRPSTFTSYCQRRELQYKSHNSPKQFQSRAKFIKAWWLWNSVLALDYDSLMDCPVCSLQPANEQVLVMDATALSLHKRQFCPVDPEVQYQPGPATSGSPVDSRIFFRDARTRDLLLRFASHGAAASAPITAAELQELKRSLSLTYLHRLLEYLLQPGNQVLATCGPLRRLLKAFAQSSPISGFIARPFDTRSGLEAVIQGTIATDAKAASGLINGCPVVAEIISHEAYRQPEFQMALVPVWVSMHQLCTAFYDRTYISLALSSLRPGLAEEQRQEPGACQAVTVQEGICCHCIVRLFVLQIGLHADFTLQDCGSAGNLSVSMSPIATNPKITGRLTMPGRLASSVMFSKHGNQATPDAWFVHCSLPPRYLHWI